MARRRVGHDPAPFGAGRGTGLGPARTARHSDGADPAPRPWWPGVRQHPVPSGWRTDGHASPRRTTRQGVGHDPAPLCAGRGTGCGPALAARRADGPDLAASPRWRGDGRGPAPLVRPHHHRWPARRCERCPSGRCPVLQDGLAFATPNVGSHWRGVGRDNGLGGRASPPAPSPTFGEGVEGIVSIRIYGMRGGVGDGPTPWPPP